LTEVSKGNSSAQNINRTLEEGVSVLEGELLLAFHWNRPSLLVAINNNRGGIRRPAEALQNRLRKKSIDVVHVMTDQAQPDLAKWIEARVNNNDRVVFFAEVTGDTGLLYRTLNLHREMFVERSIRIIFWLIKKDANIFPLRAPDFWAFRHRVVEFSSGRSRKNNTIPAGLLMWKTGLQLTDITSIQGKIQFLRDLLLRTPNQPGSEFHRMEISVELTRCYCLSGELDQAKVLLSELRKLNSKIDDPRTAMEIYNALSIFYFINEKYPEAEQALLAALKTNVDTEKLYANLAVVYSATGKHTKAMRMAAKAEKINPNSSWLLLVQGFVFINAGNFEAAIEEFNKSTNVDNTNLYAYTGLAFTYLKLNQFKKLDQVLLRLEGSISSGDQLVSACVAAFRGDVNSAIKKLRHETGKTIPVQYVLFDPALRLAFKPDDLALLAGVGRD